jgi:hypothetical protein
MEFITRTTPPRLGNLVLHPVKPKRIDQPPIVVEAMNGAQSTVPSSPS